MNKNEKKRIETKKKQIIHALKLSSNRGITNAELSKIALRYGGYLGKLYEEGYKIDKENLGDGLFNYTLISEPEVIQTRVKAVDKLLSELNKVEIITVDILNKIMNENNLTVKYKANTYK